MADVAAVASSPVSDDVELDEILRRSQVPTVVIRKDSSCADSADAVTDVDDAARLSTPAPIASFEVLSDVDESDMDDVTSLEAQRDATVDSAAAAAAAAAECHVKSPAEYRADDDHTELQANVTEAMDLSENGHTHFDDELVTDDVRSRDEERPVSAGVPTLVFEDVDANKPTSLSSPECLVNNDNDDTDDIQQQMWQWTTDQDQGNTGVANYCSGCRSSAAEGPNQPSALLRWTKQ